MSARVAFTAVSSAGLVARWSMDDASSPGLDTSGSGNDAVVFGAPAQVPGRRETGIELKGDDYLEISPTASLDAALQGGFTISAWVHPAQLPPGTDTTNGAYSIISGPGGLRLQYRHDGVFTATFGASGELISGERAPGGWVHLAMVVDPLDHSLALFVDGAPVAGSPLESPGVLYEQKWFSPNYIQHYGRYRIGVNSPQFSFEQNLFRGALDEIRIYARVLGESEIYRLSR